MFSKNGVFSCREYLKMLLFTYSLIEKFIKSYESQKSGGETNNSILSKLHLKLIILRS